MPSALYDIKKEPENGKSVIRFKRKVVIDCKRVYKVSKALKLALPSSVIRRIHATKPECVYLFPLSRRRSLHYTGGEIVENEFSIFSFIPLTQFFFFLDDRILALTSVA